MGVPFQGLGKGSQQGSFKGSVPRSPKIPLLEEYTANYRRILRRFKVHSFIKGFWDSKKALGLGFIRALRL